MRSVVRKMGNSSGLILPKIILDTVGAQAGDAVEITADTDRIVIEPIRRVARSGWADDAARVAAEGGHGLAWPEFANEGDENLAW